MTWKIDVRLYSSVYSVQLSVQCTVRGQLPNVVLTNVRLSCWFYLWGSDVICAFILIIICCEILGLWVGSHTTCVLAECAYVLWHVLIMKRFTSDVLQSCPTSLCYHDGLLRLPCKRFSFLFDCLFSRDTSTRQCTHTCTHTHIDRVTFYSADADSSWLTQVDLFPYPAAPVSSCSGSFNALCTT